MYLIKEEYFFNFLIKNKCKKQNVALIKNITKNQLQTFKVLCKDILDEKIKLTNKEFKKLVKYKNFIRNFASGKIQRNSLGRYYSATLEIISIINSKNAANTKGSFSSNRRMEPDERTTFEGNKNNTYIKSKPKGKYAKNGSNDTESLLEEQNDRTESRYEEEEEQEEEEEEEEYKGYSTDEYTSSNSEFENDESET